MDREELSFFWRVLYPILIYYGILWMIQLITGAFGENVLGAQFASPSGVSVITAIIAIPVLAYLYHADTVEVKSSTRKMKLLWYPWFIILGISCCVFFSKLVEIMQIGKYFSYYYKVTEGNIRSGGFLMSFVATAVCAPFVEELLFRGIMYRRIKDRYGSFGLSAIITSILFGVMHGNMVQFVYAVMFALVMNLVYERTGNIVSVIVIHFGANGFSALCAEYKNLNKLFQSGSLCVIITIVCAIIIIANCIYYLRLDSSKEKKKEREIKQKRGKR